MSLDIDTHIQHSSRHVGRSWPRREDRGPLTGRARYAADLRLPQMLEVVFRAQHRGARPDRLHRQVGGLGTQRRGRGLHRRRHGRREHLPRLHRIHRPGQAAPLGRGPGALRRHPLRGGSRRGPVHRRGRGRLGRRRNRLRALADGRRPRPGPGPRRAQAVRRLGRQPLRRRRAPQARGRPGVRGGRPHFRRDLRQPAPDRPAHRDQGSGRRRRRRDAHSVVVHPEPPHGADHHRADAGGARAPRPGDPPRGGRRLRHQDAHLPRGHSRALDRPQARAAGALDRGPHGEPGGVGARPRPAPRSRGRLRRRRHDPRRALRVDPRHGIGRDLHARHGAGVRDQRLHHRRLRLPPSCRPARSAWSPTRPRQALTAASGSPRARS